MADSELHALVWDGYREYAGAYWRPDRMLMTNHQNGKSTDLVFEDWTFQAGLAEDDFTPSRLRRAR